MRSFVPAALAAAGALLFAVLQWLRAPEPPGFDQSLFACYGHWIGRGLDLYRDLWDSKPPGIFALYALAERLGGVENAAAGLDALAALAAGIGGFALARRSGRAAGWPTRTATLAACGAAIAAALLPAAPAFGGLLAAGQPELLMTPLLFGAAVTAQNETRRGAFVAGLLVGMAATLKLVALALVPIVWAFAPAARRRDPRFAGAVIAGLLLPFGIAAVALGAQGTLAEAVRAVLVYPRAYLAEIASRMPLEFALGRGVDRLSGLPLLLVTAAWGARALGRARGAPLVWLGLAGLAAALQQQMAGYQLYLLAPPLALLAGFGACDLVRRAIAGVRQQDRRGVVAFALATLALAVPAAIEWRAALRFYAPHRAHRAGDLSREGFLAALGDPGRLWLEAGVIADAIRAAIAADPRADERSMDDVDLLVWGLAPAVYARSGCRPATRWVFHQTFLVEGSPLARRWPDATSRRAELVARMRADPPRFAVVVAGDRSGLEPLDSRHELEEFPALRAQLATAYGWKVTTPAYELLELRAGGR